MTARRAAKGGDVVSPWRDAFGVQRRVAPSVRAALLVAMGLDPRRSVRPPRIEPVRVVHPGARLEPPGDLMLEDGTSLGPVRRLPPDTPIGYHRVARDAGEQLLIVAPARCHLPEGMADWGWAVQLYALRSRRSWGIGDLGDLRRLARWSRGLEAAALLVNPLGAPNPGPRPEPSPYFGSTRRFRNPLYLAIEELPGADRLGAAAIARGHALNRQRRIDRIRVLALKLAAAERLWRARTGPEPRFAVYRAEQGRPLRDWAVFSVLSERFGPGWRSWPARYRDPRGPAVARVVREAAERVDFHEWLQWQLDEQLGRAAAVGPRLIADLPIGFDPGGFDAWCWQPELAAGATVGAPPDEFNLGGQDWGLPPFVPDRLRAAGYRPFIETLRATLRHAGGLRIDHVLGLFRLWWVPAGHTPADGAYVRGHADELLAVLAVESHRAAAIVIGEDLGTVESGVRRALAARNVLSTRLAHFERGPTALPRLAHGGVTTHDLPTIAGLWSGSDLVDQQRAGVAPDVRGNRLLRARLARWAAVAADAAVDEVIVAAHASLARTKSVLVTATLEDAAAVEERPNLPGTIEADRPNWSLALPRSLESLRRSGRARQVAAALRARRAARPAGGSGSSAAGG